MPRAVDKKKHIMDVASRGSSHISLMEFWQSTWTLTTLCSKMKRGGARVRATHKIHNILLFFSFVNLRFIFFN